MSFILSEEKGYFQNAGVNIMAFDDIYPDGHQAGVSIITHAKRIASNGDLRFRNLPGQWRPIPKQGERILSAADNTITTHLKYPNKDRETGFSPIKYPDIEIDYVVTVRGCGSSVEISVDLDKPIAEPFLGHVVFNIELFPGVLFGKPWIMDGKQGIFPVQPNGPFDVVASSGEIDIAPYATGRALTICPDDPYIRCKIESPDSDLILYDARAKGNDSWFVVCSEIPAGKTTNAIRWIITPNSVGDWLYPPVVQMSQVGYHPNQPKVAIIELDSRYDREDTASLYKVTETGEKLIYSEKPKIWSGNFLRYLYKKFDFSHITDEGIYKVYFRSDDDCCGGSDSKAEGSVFQISPDIYERGVWQPVLEYFLPVQMCHMRVTERFRVWHDKCHMDDAKMAPTSHNHFDGYVQIDSTLCKYKPGQHVPGLNIGGWHDAGDDDLRIESQLGECYILSLCFEEFGVDYDTTSICQDTREVHIHRPDGKNDILQQIEHGALSVLAAYKALGRLYRGIIVNDITQYVMLGDPAAQTDNIPGNDDDRWVFTEDNPPRELRASAHLAATARALRGFNDDLSNQALSAAVELFEVTPMKAGPISKENPMGDDVYHAKIHAAAELFLATSDDLYKDYLISNIDTITGDMYSLAWIAARVDKALCDKSFSNKIKSKLPELKTTLDEQCAETPYGIPYRPFIWGAGWAIQRLGFCYYFLHNAYPDVFPAGLIYNSLNFVLGCHPGSNNISFASGVGTKSALVAYGWNRADWSFYPGGVISGTALIRPDFPELLEWPFLWQQTEYVMGGGSSHYMFLVLAARKILGKVTMN